MDHELLASVASAGQSADDVAPYRFGPAVSPHLAADLAGTQIEPLELPGQAWAQTESADVLVCEGVGGFLVPLTAGFYVRDLAIALDLPLVIAAEPGLGTINHTLLTLEAARGAGLEVAAVVLSGWPDQPGDIERSNKDTIAALGDVAVCTLGITNPGELADAGAGLPVDDWLKD